MELTRAKRQIDYVSDSGNKELTMLVIVGTRTEAHFLRSQVGIGSESDCSLGMMRRITQPQERNQHYCWT